MGEWNDCDVECGGGSRTRIVQCPRDGLCSADRPTSEEACNQHSCSWDVGEWSACDAACGGGTKWREVRCPRAGRCDRSAPGSTACNEQPCVTSSEASSAIMLAPSISLAFAFFAAPQFYH